VGGVDVLSRQFRKKTDARVAVEEAILKCPTGSLIVAGKVHDTKRGTIYVFVEYYWPE